jgi:RNA polymerase sigma factor (sigma-70 family)
MGAAVVDSAFQQSFSATSRLAAVRAAAVVTLYRLPADFRSDLAQESMLELWRKRSAYDVRRGAWRTFAERVVANKMTSLVCRRHAMRRGYGREEPLDQVVQVIPALNEPIELRLDVRRVLASLSRLDRSVALALMDHSASETIHRLGISRSTAYRAIGRLRLAFISAGLRPDNRPRSVRCANAHDAVRQNPNQLRI